MGGTGGADVMVLGDGGQSTAETVPPATAGMSHFKYSISMCHRVCTGRGAHWAGSILGGERTGRSVYWARCVLGGECTEQEVYWARCLPGGERTGHERWRSR